jgi:hypothetical protein
MSKEQEDDGDTRKGYRDDKIREFGRHVRLGPFAWWWISYTAKRKTSHKGKVTWFQKG